jgi:hypothetical protein
MWECRDLSWGRIPGTLPTELGTLTALTNLCVHRPHPPRLHACAVTGSWAECGGGVGAQVSISKQSHGHTAHTHPCPDACAVIGL